MIFRPGFGLQANAMTWPPRPVVHLELRTGDVRGAQAFYEGMCGWRPEHIESRHGSYLGLDLAREFGGGIVEAETERAIWLPYAQVGDIQAATERARKLGAAILLEPREGPAGWRSVIETPAGGQLAFWQHKR